MHTLLLLYIIIITGSSISHGVRFIPIFILMSVLSIPLIIIGICAALVSYIFIIYICSSLNVCFLYFNFYEIQCFRACKDIYHRFKERNSFIYANGNISTFAYERSMKIIRFLSLSALCVSLIVFWIMGMVNITKKLDGDLPVEVSWTEALIPFSLLGWLLPVLVLCWAYQQYTDFHRRLLHLCPNLMFLIAPCVSLILTRYVDTLSPVIISSPIVIAFGIEIGKIEEYYFIN